MKPTIGNPAPGNAQRHRPANSLGQAGGPLLGGALFIWQINAPYLFSGLRFQKLKEEKKMSCCSDVMKPIEAGVEIGLRRPEEGDDETSSSHSFS